MDVMTSPSNHSNGKRTDYNWHDDNSIELSSSPRINIPVGRLPISHKHVHTPSHASYSYSGNHGLSNLMDNVYDSNLTPKKSKDSIDMLSNGQTSSSINDLKSPMSRSNFQYETYDALVNTSINPILLKKLQDRQQSVLVLEVTNDGAGDYKLMSLRELLLYINGIAKDIDSKYNANILPKNPSIGRNGVAEGKDVRRGSMSSTSNANFADMETSNNPITPQSILSQHLNNQSALLLSDDEREVPANGLNGTGNIPKDNKSFGAQYLRHRDLRRLEYQFNPLGEPTVFVRRHSVLVSMDPMRAIIMADRLVLIVPEGMEAVLDIFDRHLNAWSDSDNLPFEARAYEGIFSTVIAIQTEDYEVFNQQTLEVLSEYKHASIISIEKQEQLRLLKNKVTSMSVKIAAYKRVIEEVLNEDHDMALMNLTKLKKKPTLYHVPLSVEILNTHEEIEVLFESYLMDYNYLESKLDYLKSQILSAEELVLLRLDTSRNQLLIADTCIAIVACSIGFGSFVGSMFGMNLKNHHEEEPGWFRTVTLMTVVSMVVIVVCVIVLLRGIGVIPHEYLNCSWCTRNSDDIFKKDISFPSPSISSPWLTNPGADRSAFGYAPLRGNSIPKTDESRERK